MLKSTLNNKPNTWEDVPWIVSGWTVTSNTYEKQQKQGVRIECHVNNKVNNLLFRGFEFEIQRTKRDQDTLLLQQHFDNSIVAKL